MRRVPSNCDPGAYSRFLHPFTAPAVPQLPCLPGLRCNGVDPEGRRVPESSRPILDRLGGVGVLGPSQGTLYRRLSAVACDRGGAPRRPTKISSRSLGEVRWRWGRGANIFRRQIFTGKLQSAKRRSNEVIHLGGYGIYGLCFVLLPFVGREETQEWSSFSRNQIALVRRQNVEHGRIFPKISSTLLEVL